MAVKKVKKKASTARAYYNEIDPFVGRWLRNLIQAKLITEGWVDVCGIETVRSAAAARSTRAHFFAGIGGWDLALQLAGWPKDQEVWTGSCPCQPFSNAGNPKGEEDERHLWPAWLRLIEECRPPIIFGEQVASPLGREWLVGVRTDLEALGYRVGAADLCAAGVGAPHIRQRLYWVADTDSIGREGLQTRRLQPIGPMLQTTPPTWSRSGSANYQNADGKTRRIESGTLPLAHGLPNRVGALSAYGNSIVPQLAAEFIAAYMECR